MARPQKLDRCQATFQAICFRLLGKALSLRHKPNATSLFSVYLKNKSKEFDLKNKTVKFGAFMPDLVGKPFETSAYNISKLTSKKIWKLGHLWTVVNPRHRRTLVTWNVTKMSRQKRSNDNESIKYRTINCG